MPNATSKNATGTVECADNVATCEDNEAGFALIAVIWITGLLAVVTSGFVVNVTSQIFLSRNIAEGKQLDGVASGITMLKAYDLAQMDNSGAAANGWKSCAWNKDIISFYRIQDQGGLVDLNTAAPELLLALLGGITRDPQLSQKIYDDIQDFKDADRLSVRGGDEPVSYQNKTNGPKNAPFESPFELDQIPAVSEELLSQLLGFVTVQSQQTGIDLSKVPDEFLASINPGLNLGTDIQTYNQPSASRIYSIDTVAIRKGGGRFHRRAMINVLRQPEKPFAILEWRRAGGGDYDKITAIENPKPCIIE